MLSLSDSLEPVRLTLDSLELFVSYFDILAPWEEEFPWMRMDRKNSSFSNHQDSRACSDRPFSTFRPRQLRTKRIGPIVKRMQKRKVYGFSLASLLFLLISLLHETKGISRRIGLAEITETVTLLSPDQGNIADE